MAPVRLPGDRCGGFFETHIEDLEDLMRKRMETAR